MPVTAVTAMAVSPRQPRHASQVLMTTCLGREAGTTPIKKENTGLLGNIISREDVGGQVKKTSARWENQCHHPFGYAQHAASLHLPHVTCDKLANQPSSFLQNTDM